MGKALLFAVVGIAYPAFGLTKCPSDALDGQASIDARLDASSCRLREFIPGDQSENPTRLYVFEVVRRGVLTIEASSNEVDTVLLITNPRFIRTGLNDDREQGRTDSRLVLSLTPDTYYIYVISKRGTGAFTLRASFSEEPPCQIRDLPPDTHTGTLAAGACRLLDGFAPSDLSFPADIFQFRIEGNKVVTALMESRAVDSLLVLADSKTGQVIAFDDDGGGGSNALVLTSLPTGEYALIAAGSVPGAYTLGVRVEDPRPCQARDIGFGDQVSGTLSAEDCRLLDLDAPEDTPLRTDLYRVQVQEPGIITADITAGQFPAAVLLLDADRKILATAAESVPLRPQTVRMETSVRPGQYFIGVTHRELQAGPYQLTAAFDRARRCDPAPLDPPAQTTGNLANSGCRFQDLLPHSQDTTIAVPYRVTLAQPAQLTVEMTSTNVDSYVWILDSTGRVIADDDNSAGGSNARLAVRLLPGTYTVIANSARIQTGSYSFRVAAAEPRACDSRPLPFGETATGQLATDDCLVRDVMVNSARPVQARIHWFDVAEAGTITVDAGSFAFAPHLILVDAEAKRITEDVLDSRQVAGAARIRRALAPGRYGIVVSATAGVAGEYLIRASLAR